MRAFTVAIAAIIIFSTASCKKSSYKKETSACINNTIEQNKNNKDWGYISVEEYEYQGNLVYIFVPDSIYADMQTAITKSDCTNLCYLGGIAGNEMCNGDKFFDKAIFRRKVWER